MDDWIVIATETCLLLFTFNKRQFSMLVTINGSINKSTIATITLQQFLAFNISFCPVPTYFHFISSYYWWYSAWWVIDKGNYSPWVMITSRVFAILLLECLLSSKYLLSHNKMSQNLVIRRTEKLEFWLLNFKINFKV